MQIYVISIQRAAERRASIEGQLQKLGLAYEMIEGVDGRELKPEDRAQYSAAASIRTIGRELVPEEIGCALSHLAVYRRIIEKGHAALILEDDAILGPDVPEVLASRDRFPHDWELILLCHFGSYTIPWGKTPVTPKHRAVRFFSRVLSTAGYIINVAGAAKLLRQAYPIRIPADGLTGRFRDYGIRLYGIMPRCIVANTFPSTIWFPGDDRLSRKPNKKS